MARIKTLQIHNYKFFDNQKPIALNSKHLLLYGENGSGKSSIYWSLHTLFESSLKTDVEEIKKYFYPPTDERPESLVNIYATTINDDIEHCNSFIEVVTDEDADNIYRVSLKDLGIKDNIKAQETNKASDFISYKVLYKFQDFWNGESMNLANIFISNILPFIEFPENEIIRDGTIKIITNAKEMWDEIKIGPGTTINGKGKTIQVYKYSEENQKFNAFVGRFNDNIQKLIEFINIEAPLILAKFGYDIDFELNFKAASFHKADSRFHWHNDFIILFKITKYLGDAFTINRPQSFLNEAKITAIGLSIRLAILKKRINEEAGDRLKFIVLDDVMISLDMNNRDRLIDFLISDENKFTTNYQILFLTHERSLFHFVMNKIKTNGQKDDWVYKEIYVNNLDENESPAIYNYPNKLEKAEYYLYNHDYPACGIYLRTKCEKLIDSLLPDSFKKTTKISDNSGLHETVSLNLNDKIKKLEEFFMKENIDFGLFKDLVVYKNVLLNALAHNDLHSPLYKIELQKIIAVLKKLEEYKRETILLKPNSSLTFELIRPDHTKYIVGLTLNDSLYILEKPDGSNCISNICAVRITCINDNGCVNKSIGPVEESISKILVDTCFSLGIHNHYVIEDVVVDRYKNSLRQLIHEKLNKN